MDIYNSYNLYELFFFVYLQKIIMAQEEIKRIICDILRFITGKNEIYDYLNLHDDLDIDFFYHSELECDIINNFKITNITSSEWERFWRSNPTVYELCLFIENKIYDMGKRTN